MLPEVSNYNKVIKYFKEMQLNPTPSQLKSPAYLKKFFSNSIVNDYLEILAEPRLLQLDQIFEDYADCKISNNKMQTLISNEEYHLYNSVIRHCLERRSSKTETNRQMQVIWITGPSGSGKTTLAKYFADKLGYEAYVTSNSDNMFDSYDLQPCIIVDEFRASTMKFSNFLQMTDNHTNKKQAARYHDVDLSKCKLMIITSINTPFDTYRMFKTEDGNLNTEPVEQLARRLKHRYYEIVDSVVQMHSTEDESYQDVINMNSVYTYLGIDPKRVDSDDLLAQFYDVNLSVPEPEPAPEDIALEGPAWLNW